MYTVYLDVSCLNRPFDKQDQERIRLETEAILKVFDCFQAGLWKHVASETSEYEVEQIADKDKRHRVELLLPDSQAIMELNDSIRGRSRQLQSLGFRPADALHVAAAEELVADILLSCDDKLCKLGKRHQELLRIKIANPVTWLEEIDHADP